MDSAIERIYHLEGELVYCLLAMGFCGAIELVIDVESLKN